jgi:hypothetical protein
MMMIMIIITTILKRDNTVSINLFHIVILLDTLYYLRVRGSRRSDHKYHTADRS